MFIGPDFRPAPAEVEGIPWELWAAMTSRAETYYGRMFGAPTFGLGLDDFLGAPQPGIQEAERRLEESVATLPAWMARAASVRQVGDALVLRVRLS